MKKKPISVIPPAMRKEMEADPFYSTCCLYGQEGHECAGRITWEHAIIYKSNKVQEKWAIIPLCASGHSVDEYQDNGKLNKRMNEWVAYSRATDEDILKLTGEFEHTPLSKAHSLFQEKQVRINTYGKYVRIVPTDIITQKLEYPKPEAPKKFWFEVKDDFKVLIQEAIDYHKTTDEVFLTPHQMIEMMIATYEPSLGKKRVEKKLEALEEINHNQEI